MAIAGFFPPSPRLSFSLSLSPPHSPSLFLRSLSPRLPPATLVLRSPPPSPCSTCRHSRNGPTGGWWCVSASRARDVDGEGGWRARGESGCSERREGRGWRVGGTERDAVDAATARREGERRNSLSPTFHPGSRRIVYDTRAHAFPDRAFERESSLSPFPLSLPPSLFLYVRTYVRCLYARAIRATVGM